MNTPSCDYLRTIYVRGRNNYNRLRQNIFVKKRYTFYELYFIIKNNKIYTNIFKGTKVKAYLGNEFEVGKKLYIYA